MPPLSLGAPRHLRIEKLSPDGPGHDLAFINRVASIVPGIGHGTFTHRPELMNLAVLEFLDSESSPASTH